MFHLCHPTTRFVSLQASRGSTERAARGSPGPAAARAAGARCLRARPGPEPVVSGRASPTCPPTQAACRSSAAQASAGGAGAATRA